MTADLLAGIEALIERYSTQLDPARILPALRALLAAHPVQVTTAEVGEALRQTGEPASATAWRYEHGVPMPRLWVLNFLATLGIVVSDRPEETP